MDADIEIGKGKKWGHLEEIYSVFWGYDADPHINEQFLAIILGLAEPVEMP